MAALQHGQARREAGGEGAAERVPRPDLAALDGAQPLRVADDRAAVPLGAVQRAHDLGARVALRRQQRLQRGEHGTRLGRSGAGAQRPGDGGHRTIGRTARGRRAAVELVADLRQVGRRHVARVDRGSSGPACPDGGRPTRSTGRACVGGYPCAAKRAVASAATANTAAPMTPIQSYGIASTP